jgi:hypothetical protein
MEIFYDKLASNKKTSSQRIIFQLRIVLSNCCGATTLRKTTFSITHSILSVVLIVVMLSITMLCYVMLSVFILGVILLGVT